MKLLLTLILGVAALQLVSCGDESEDGSDIAGSCSATYSCTEYSGTGADASTLQVSCESASATWSTGSCTQTNSCGNCSSNLQGFISVIYYFDGAGAESTLQSTCEVFGTWNDNSSVTCS